MLASSTLSEPPVSLTSGQATSSYTLIQRVQQGDHAAFARLHRKEVGRVYAICLRMLADRVWAEEMVQDVFVRVWERIGSFRGDGPFEAWLRKLTVNAVLVALRSARRRNARVFTTDDLSSYDQPGSIATPGVRLDLEHAIARLPEKARLVFVLHDIEGYRHREIADMIGITVGTTKSQLHRARCLLREALET